MAESLKIKYQNLLKKYGLDQIFLNENMHHSGMMILRSFMSSRKQVAIYGYGELTKKLMGEFIFELKDVKYIIDDNISNENSGYTIISESEISKYEIDGVILCCKDNVKEIAKRIISQNEGISCLPLSAIYGQTFWYANPNVSYSRINFLQIKINSSLNIDEQNMIDLMIRYIEIKDFQSAINVGKKIYRLIKPEVILSIINDLEDLYKGIGVFSLRIIEK